MGKYKDFSDKELVKALNLMVTKEDLTIREVAEAILAAFSYSAEEIREQLNLGEPLSDGVPLGLC